MFLFFFLRSILRTVMRIEVAVCAKQLRNEFVPHFQQTFVGRQSSHLTWLVCALCILVYH